MPIRIEYSLIKNVTGIGMLLYLFYYLTVKLIRFIRSVFEQIEYGTSKNLIDPTKYKISILEKTTIIEYPFFKPTTDITDKTQLYPRKAITILTDWQTSVYIWSSVKLHP